jgi:hypothetical protein
MRQHACSLFAITILIAAVGVCGFFGGTQRGAVSGTVTFDGSPVTDGVISLQPTGDTEGPSAGGHVQAGRYAIAAARGPFPGRYRVEITASRKTGRVVMAEGFGDETIDESEQFIPAKYNAESTLEVEIKAGRNTADFDLKSID